MKQVKIHETIFKKILAALKDSVGTTYDRPVLQYIRLEIKKNQIIGYSPDGFQAGRIILDCEEENDEEFAIFFKPFPFKVTKQAKEYVVLSLSDDGVTGFVEFQTEFGAMRYSYHQPGEWNIEIENVFKNGKTHDREIGVSAGRLARACKAICASIDDRYKTTILESSDDKLKAFCLSAKEEGIVIDQLILPIRIHSTED